MITTATEQHIPAIKALWTEAFGGESGYADMFLRRRAEPSNILLYLQGDTLCAMLFMLPCRLAFGNLSHRCAYLYAIATRRAHRGRGMSTALLDAAYQLCGKRGYSLCALTPAEPSLFDFYQKRGYATQGYVNTLTLDSSKLTATIPFFSPITAEELLTLRREAFGDGYLEWDQQALDYSILENQHQGGRFYRYRLGEHTGFLGCVPTPELLWVREFAGDSAILPEVASGLGELYHRESCRFRLRSDAPVGERTPLVMTRWITRGTDQPFYGSHLLE